MSSSAKIHDTNSTSQGRFQIKLSYVHHPGCKFEAVENYLGLSGEGIYLIDDTRGHVAAACAAGGARFNTSPLHSFAIGSPSAASLTTTPEASLRRKINRRILCRFCGTADLDPKASGTGGDCQSTTRSANRRLGESTAT